MAVSTRIAAEPGPLLLRAWIARAAGRHPDKPYIVAVDQDKTLTYGALAGLTGRIAAYLRERGVEVDQRITLLANNSIEHLACYLGVMAYGATICTVHVEMNRRHLDHILPALRPRLIAYQAGLALDDLIAEAGAPRLPLGAWDAPEAGSFYAAVAASRPGAADFTAAGPGNDGCILFTSGTSDRPKGVVLSYRELLANAEPTADGFGMTADDRIYDFRSYNWCSAQVLSALAPLAKGATLIMAERFSRSRFFAHIRAHGATIAAGNPTTVNMLLGGPEAVGAADVPTLRFVISSSAPLLPEEWRRFEARFGIKIAQGYGTSETGWIAASPGESRRFGAAGRPLPYLDVAVVDGEGRRLPAGETGAVELGGFAGNAYRYLGEDGAAKVASRGRTRTGDLWFIDAEGFLHLTGREKELIIRGGVNISPLEIDGVLLGHAEVLEAATVGVPDPTYGEEVVSYVVLRPGAGAAAADLLRHCRAALPAFKAPKRIVLRDALPKTERGKLDRKALVAAWTSSGEKIGA